MNTSVIIDSPARISSWRNATWSEYLECVENLGEQERIFFNLDTIWIDMGNEGINHSRFNELFTLILFVWCSRQTDVKFDLLGGCVMEKPQTQSAAPDKVLYIDVKGRQVLAFRLVDGKYEQCSESVALTGLQIPQLSFGDLFFP